MWLSSQLEEISITGDHTRHWHRFKSGHLPSQHMGFLCPKPHTVTLSYLSSYQALRRRWARVGHVGLKCFDPALRVSQGCGTPYDSEQVHLSSTAHVALAWLPCVPLPAAGFHFSKQCSSHTGDNSSLIMGVTTKQLCVSHCPGLSLEDHKKCLLCDKTIMVELTLHASTKIFLYANVIISGWSDSGGSHHFPITVYGLFVCFTTSELNTTFKTTLYVARK